MLKSNIRLCYPLALSSLVATALGTSPAAALLIRDDLSLSDYTTEALSSPLNATGGFQINGTFDSSGVLVAPNVVVGAAHAGASAGPSQRTFLIGGTSYGVASVVRLDGNTNATDGRDVAIFTLTAPVAGIAPAALYTGTPQALVGRDAVFTGLGDQGTGSSGPGATDGVLLAGTNIVDASGLTVTNRDGTTTTLPDAIIFADFDNPLDANDSVLGTTTATRLETQGTVGDSGGGLFVQNAATGQFELAALHSVALSDGGIGYGSISGSTTFAPTDLATILAAVPEPASGAVLAAISSAFAVIRRRRS